MAVRETWVSGIMINEKPVNYGEVSRFYYKAINNNAPEWYRPDLRDDHPNYLTPPWKSAAIMPREAARLFLRIINIRVMRVQELKESDALAQAYGQLCDCKIPVYPGACEHCYNTGYNYPPLLDMKEKNQKVWNDNQYMWIVDFTKTEKL